MKNLVVLKFGGSSLATPEHIRAVAAKLKNLYESGKKLIVVTSAMGKTTDELTTLAYKVSPQPNRRELDMLISTGERVSMSLMAMALHDLNCPSISFTGSQAGILTNSAFSNADIQEIKPVRVEQALLENKIVVLAGFQGVDPATKEITTLGRGGSDTTAVAMAAHFKAERCEILKDVDGVFSADPKIVPNAKMISQMSADKLFEMCFWGAKVLNYRSVQWACDHKVPLYVGRSDDFSIGTRVLPIPNENKTAAANNNTGADFLAINSHEVVYEISIPSVDAQDALLILNNTFQQAGLPVPQILRSDYNIEKGQWLALITSPTEIMNSAKSILKNSHPLKLLNDSISTVTATFQTKPYELHIVNRSERVEFIRNLHSKFIPN